MKLEKIEDVDSSTFEMKDALGADNNYYKLCVFEQDFDNITIVDKNTRLASYWFEKFLGLSRVRDEYENTSELIELIDSKKLFLEDSFDEEKKSAIYKATEDFIFKNEVFDKLNLLNYLIRKHLIKEAKIEKVYTLESIMLDYEFTISDKKMKEKYKKTIEISNETKIRTDNFEKLKRRQGIELDGNKIILTVDMEFLKSVKKDLSIDDGRE